MPTVSHHFGLILTKECERDPSPAEISSASALDKFLQLTDSISPVPLGWARAPSDADPASIKDTKHIQACSEDQSTNRIHPIHSEESSGEANEFVTFPFPKKLWKMLQSHFQSVWCVSDSICVAIDEEAFLKEVPA
ncbi:heat shock transcription factor, Y-linked-like protein [Amazona aestiva]|uniref:Heat shock transcription factor, Y-linked-like protein n=1 Tax=Amazona aestiva TaxID=12930 RepID=A0A0Q3QT54_AMAAE|nr:heat shock transcription factor, Y-linked-like protein [Amazona aestiva]